MFAWVLNTSQSKFATYEDDRESEKSTKHYSIENLLFFPPMAIATG